MGNRGESRLALDKGTRIMSEDMKQMQVVVQRGSGVSRALWPASAQKCVATSKEAQRRRDMIIQGKRWSILADCSSVSLSLVLIVAISMVMSGAVVAAFVGHLWYMLLVALMLLPLLLHTLVNARAKAEVRSLLLSFRRTKQAKTVRGTQETRGKPAFLAKSHARLQLQMAPRTSVPDESLVRVLETVDLSQSEVEHFIGADAESEERSESEGGGRERDTAAPILNLKADLAPVKNVK